MHSQFARFILNSIQKTPKSTEFANKVLFCNQLFPKNVNINKFIGNAVTEELFARLLNDMHIQCTRTETDFRICSLPYSLKSSSKIGSELIIKNHYGACKDFISLEPTFVIVTEIEQTSILYIDQELVNNAEYDKPKVKYSDSNVVIPGGLIRHLFNTENSIQIKTGYVPYTKQACTSTFLTNYVSLMFEISSG